MAKAFEGTRGTLASRMLSALRAGAKEGGDRRGMESSALVVVHREPWFQRSWPDNWVNIRVDMHPRPIGELERILRADEAATRKYLASRAAAALMEEARKGLGTLGNWGFRRGRREVQPLLHPWTDRVSRAEWRPASEPVPLSPPSISNVLRWGGSPSRIEIRPRLDDLRDGGSVVLLRHFTRVGGPTSAQIRRRAGAPHGRSPAFPSRARPDGRFLAFADQLRRAGHTVHTPDLFDRHTFALIDEGVPYPKKVGFGPSPTGGAKRPRAFRVAWSTPFLTRGDVGAVPRPTRPGEKGALLFSGAFRAEEFGGRWPEHVPFQIHMMEGEVGSGRGLDRRAETGRFRPGRRALPLPWRPPFIRR